MSNGVHVTRGHMAPRFLQGSQNRLEGTLGAPGGGQATPRFGAQPSSPLLHAGPLTPCIRVEPPRAESGRIRERPQLDSDPGSTLDDPTAVLGLGVSVELVGPHRGGLAACVAQAPFLWAFSRCRAVWLR